MNKWFLAHYKVVISRYKHLLMYLAATVTPHKLMVLCLYVLINTTENFSVKTSKYRTMELWQICLVRRRFSQETFSHGANYQMNDGWIPFRCFSFRVLVLLMLTRCHGLNKTKSSFMWLLTHILVWQVKMSVSM